MTHIPSSHPPLADDEDEDEFLPSNLDFPVIGIGASAGGLKAVLRFLENLGPAGDMAFVIALHLSARHQSNVREVLQRATTMPVQEVTTPTFIEKGRVYVVAPGRQLLMRGACLVGRELPRQNIRHVSIDAFFRSLADAHRERSFGIVLSGTGSDGTAGLLRLKEQGGVTLAQRADEAAYDGMPLAAINAGAVDFILPVSDMPSKLIDIWRNARIIELPPLGEPDAPLTSFKTSAVGKDSEEALHDIIKLLHAHTGHDFRPYKRATVLRRIERRMQVRGVSDLRGYRQLLEADPEEGKALLKDLLIGVTHFFRDRDAFNVLQRDIIPGLFKGKPPGAQVRAWVAACSTGEEAYSLAMLLSDHAGMLSRPPEIQVFATDIDEVAINSAREGTYPASVASDLSPSQLRRFFTREDGRYRIRKIVRDRILFAAHNLLRDPPFSKLDLITCRNLLIYLNRDAQTQLLEIFHFALNGGGYLLLGNSESADMVNEYFIPVDKKNRIYRAKAVSRSARSAPSLPLRSMARSPAGMPAPAERRKATYADVHQRTLAQHAPPSLLVNDDSNILHMSETAGRYLQHVGGEPSRNLLALIRPELRTELRTALFQAQQNGSSITTSGVRVMFGEQSHYVGMSVHPFRDEDTATGMVLVLFEEQAEAVGATAHQGEQAAPNPPLALLEKELQRTRAQLQETIEHSEISTEELKTSNEELQAINEELRSATEELETSKEELQSINEELIAVNYELKVKVEETAKVNDDLNNLIASTDIATVFVDSGMRIKRYTPRATDIFSLIASDLGRSLLDITHRLEYAQLADDAATTFETLRLVEREVHSSDGRLYIARMLPYRTTEDRIEGAVLTFFDITGLRQAEERLRAGEERMRLVADSTKDYAIITCDTGGRITSWNTGAERIFGYTEQEVAGQMIDIIYLQEDRTMNVPDEERRRAREDGRAEDERWHLRKDGSRFFCSGVVTPLHNGEFYGYAKICRDMTGRVQIDSERKTQDDLADSYASDAMKDDFLAIMSHELKHPLNLIQINAELLARLPEVRKSGVGAKAADTIRSSVMSQAKIIDDLLDLSRIHTGKLGMSLADIDLSALIGSLVELMQADPAARELTIGAPDRHAPVLVRADLVRLEQLLLNLLSNAIKFTPPGGTIAVRLEREDHMARVDVIDSGQGIAPDFLPRVFEMFGQAAPVTTRSKGGLGIGLALVKQIAELHGGRVEASSDGLGRGARFTVWLPLAGATALPDAPEREARHDRLAGLRILLVDDMDDALWSFKMLLEFEQAVVHTANRAQLGLEILDEHPVDLIVCDISMPDMDGYTFIQEVRKRPNYANVPAIAATGLSRTKDVERAYEAGFSAHVGKPISLETMVNVVANLWEGKDGADDLD